MMDDDHEATSVTLDSRGALLAAAFDQLRRGIDELERTVLAALAGRAGPVSGLPVHRDVMKPREYAEHVRVNVRKVHTWIHRGMPHFLLEGRIRIRVAEADSWLETCASAAPKPRADGKEPRAARREPSRLNKQKEVRRKTKTPSA